MFFFLQMSENQTLPVFIQHILTAFGGKNQTAARLSRFETKMYLRIMAKWFIMSHSGGRIPYRFLIHNIARPKFHLQMKSLFNETFQNLGLYLSHQLNMDFSQLAVPHQMKLRVFLLQLPELPKGFCHIRSLRQYQLAGEHRLQLRFRLLCLDSQPLSCKGFR